MWDPTLHEFMQLARQRNGTVGGFTPFLGTCNCSQFHILLRGYAALSTLIRAEERWSPPLLIISSCGTPWLLMDGSFHAQIRFGHASKLLGTFSYPSYSIATVAPTVCHSNPFFNHHLCTSSQALSANGDCDNRVHDDAVAAPDT